MASLQAAAGGFADDPTTIIIAAQHAVDRPATAAAVDKLDRLLRADSDVASVSAAVPASNGRFLRINVVSRLDPASQQAQAFGSDLREDLIPAAHFPLSDLVLAGGGAAYAVDFVSRTLGSFPWLILAVVGLTYLLLVRAFRSLFLPLKAIVLNLLTVSAASGLMIAAFQWGWGSWAGLVHVHEIESWIPVFMFTLLFGLSMDYEVFLVSRMREAWDVYEDEPRRRRSRHREHRPHHQRGRADHGRDVQRADVRLDPDDAATRLRARDRDHDRHHARAGTAAPLDDGVGRPLELVPPALGGSQPPAAPVSVSRDQTRARLRH